MSPAQRAEADAVAVALKKPKVPKPKKVTVLPYIGPKDPGRGKAGVLGRSAGGRSGSAHTPVPLTPPQIIPGAMNPGATGGRYEDYENYPDNGLTWSGWNGNKREVSRDGRPIGFIRRVIKEKPDGSVTETFRAEPTGKDKGVIPWPSDWEAAQKLLEEDMSDDAERTANPTWLMPEGYEPFPGTDDADHVSSKVSQNRGETVRLVAMGSEKIGSVRRVREKTVIMPDPVTKRPKNVKVPVKGVVWGIFPKSGSSDRPFRTEREAVDGLIAHHKRQKAKASTTPLVHEPLPTPKPLPKRSRRATMPDPDRNRRRRDSQNDTVLDYPVILEEGAGKAPTPPKVTVDTSATAFLSRGSLNLPFRTTPGAPSSAGRGPLPASQMWVPRVVRELYDDGTKLAARGFEGSTKVPVWVRDNLRQLEATGDYLWTEADIAETPNGVTTVRGKVTEMNPMWVFSQVKDGQRIGPVLAVSQPDFDNYIYDNELIKDVLAEAAAKYGANLPRRGSDPRHNEPRKKRGTKNDDIDLEEKARHIRTPEGAAKYGGAIGDEITLDAPVSKPQSPDTTPNPTGTNTSTPSGHDKPKRRVKVTPSPKAKLRRSDTQTPSGNPKPARGVDVEAAGKRQGHVDAYLAISKDADDDPKRLMRARAAATAIETATKYVDDGSEPAARRSAISYLQNIWEKPEDHPADVVAFAKAKLTQYHILKDETPVKPVDKPKG
jgi:hypothetical protein